VYALAATSTVAGGATNSASVACLDYAGSYNLDDLSWLAYNKDIFDFTAKTATTPASHYITTYAVYTGTSTGSTDKCTAEGLMRTTATNGGTLLYTAANPTALETALTDAFLAISKRAAAGTAASVLGERGQLGMNVLQAVFYPSKLFATGEKLSWIGYMNNIWYYNDRAGIISNLREDTVENDVLNLLNDYVMEFAFINQELKIQRWQDTDGNGTPNTAITPDITLDDFKPVWEAGEILQNRVTERVIYVNDNVNTYPKIRGGSLTTFTTANKATFQALLGDVNGDTLVDAGDAAAADKVINYVRGADQAGYRSRMVNAKEWKLGDIVYSTPDVVEYDNYSVVYVGSNDGMLHAFKVGKLTSFGLVSPDKTRLLHTVGAEDNIPVGDEMWAFIPKNALPYLRYLTDPLYCHVYIVDLRNYVTPLAYKGKKLLIGGMRLGGRCGGASTFVPKTDVCPTIPTNMLNSLGTDGVNTSSGNDCVGLSSYFALDVTDPTAPILLWEFSHPNLKFSYSGPAVINRANRTYVMLLSGPDAYDGTVTAAQNLNAFVLKLDKEALTIETVTRKDFGAASFARSFGGRLFTEGLDINEDGNTDFVFFGYSQYGGTSGGEDVWSGGIIKAYTGNVDPALWNYDSNYVTFDVDGVAGTEGYPFAGKVMHQKCFSDSRYHLYFGSGLFFKANQTYSSTKADIIAGIPFKCNASNVCDTATIALDSNSTVPATVCTNLSAAISGGGDLWSSAGWLQKLNLASGVYLKERAISDPTTTRFNFAMYATTEPSGDMCAFAGQSRIWALNCATGSAVSDTTCSGKVVAPVQGQLLMQLSTAAIVETNVSDFFEPNADATSDSFTGITPESSPPFIPLSPKKTKLLHWLER
jgi:type IV pilus assembly protein PilY1